MKKIIFIIGLIFNLSNVCNAQKVDTIYYDKDWKGVESKSFAAYVRVASYAKDSHYVNRYMDYYSTGELQSEGCFISIDKYDDSKSIFDGNCKTYYMNKKIKEDLIYKDGKQNGDDILYYENGLIWKKSKFTNGKLDGIYYEFTEDRNACSQLEFKDGEPATPYFIYSTKDGLATKYNIKDKSLYLEIPSLNDKQIYTKNGVSWDYYLKNGLCVMVNPSIRKEYGKYFTLYVLVTNNSVKPIIFDPSLITAYKTKKGENENLSVLNSDEYMKKVKRSQGWSKFFNAIGEAAVASSAGYSSSSTNTNSTNAGYSVAGVVGTNGAAVGASQYANESNTSSQTVNYNGAAAYQANLIANDRIANYDNQLLQERNTKEEGYLKTTTIDSGETISGYVNIKYEKGDELFVNIAINAITYPFVWNIGK
nr:hypothetical protein [uncultured Bacteroides sp.]